MTEAVADEGRPDSPLLHDALSARPYPGRGLLVANVGGDDLVAVYFLTGRSAASRTRELRLLQNGDVQVADTSGGAHDDLRHYLAVAQRGSWLVVGNGSQVETLAEDLAAGIPLSSE